MRRPIHDDDIFSKEGIVFMIDDASTFSKESHLYVPWPQVRSIKKFINRGGIWKNCPIDVDRWTFGMILYDMKYDT
tara:strand:+ start:332 stop:559 length:228 start_codon:yes stop_codon:yes gene_type:complete